MIDTDLFRFCLVAGTHLATAAEANCAGDGAGGSNGINSDNAPIVAVDFTDASGGFVDYIFAALYKNIKAGDVYTIQVYGDDGWKTVNGQAGKTPLSTYTSTLAALPLSAAALAGTGPTADLFARVTSSTKTPADIATAIRTKAAISTGLTWTAPGPMPDGRAVALLRVGVYENGRASSTGAAWPASTKTDFSYPASVATATTVNIPAPVAALVVPTLAGTNLVYVNRNGNKFTSTYRYQ